MNKRAPNVGRPARLATAAIILSLMVSSAAAQPAQLVQFYRNAFLTVANNYRNLVRQYVSPQERPILDAISFRFDSSQNIFAQAYVLGGERIIELSFGFLAIMENLTMAYTVSGEAGKDACFIGYLDTVAATAVANERARRDRKPLQLIPFFAHYVAHGGQGCGGITQQDMQNPAAWQAIPSYMDAIMTVIIAHEIGHHVLGQFEDPKLADPTNLAASREAESKADRWAVEHSFAIGSNPAPGVPMWAFFAATGGADRKAEIASTHPLGMRRWAAALEESVAYVKSPAYAQKFGKPHPSAVVAEFERQLGVIKKVLPK